MIPNTPDSPNRVCFPQVVWKENRPTSADESISRSQLGTDGAEVKHMQQLRLNTGFGPTIRLAIDPENSRETNPMLENHVATNPKRREVTNPESLKLE